ncbi:unnamed protein product [Heligmosomoides polygyrus]|uniref:Uncharacterized protein n=1 Tax=Heligmosomoides polygyrus TaxID=6339 RepID=A0A183GFI5_HELPZ|nr:unnamed protein product [Heligmosomoides polygyrus]
MLHSLQNSPSIAHSNGISEAQATFRVRDATVTPAVEDSCNVLPSQLQKLEVEPYFGDIGQFGKETFSAYHSAKCAGIPSDKEGDHKLNEEVNRLWSLEAIGITDDPDSAFDAKENERII